MSRANKEKRARKRARHLAEQTKPWGASPTDGSTFTMARDICGVILSQQGREALASQLDAASTSDRDIARAYASGMRPVFQSEAFEGAISALRENESPLSDGCA